MAAIKPTADFTQITKELGKVAKAWATVAKEQAKTTAEVGKLAKAIDKQSTQLTKIQKELQALTKSYRDLVNQQKAAARAAASVAQASKKTQSDTAKEIKLTDRMIQRGYTMADIRKKQATTGEVVDYKNQIGRLKELQKAHGVTYNQVSRMWNELASGGIRAYQGGQRQVFNQLVKIKSAQEQLGVAARKAYSKEILARYDSAAESFAKQHLRIKGISGPLGQVKRGIDDLTVSWKSFVRLLAVQLFHQAVSAMIRGIASVTKEVIQLEIKIAEVQTISQNLPLSFEQWRGGLFNIADVFGLDSLDIVEGAYQTLSNQVAEGAKTFDFLRSSSKLAVTAVSNEADSVNLLTAALNAFNLDIDKTEEISSKFFKTVELGRVRIGEMANTFGRVAVPASQLKISIEELQAAIASSTIQGLKYNEAATYIRNVLIKLIRPTDEMKGLFKQWGVESGEAAIRTFGFAEVLGKIENYAQGSSTELGELFGRIRAITGAMLFSGEGLTRYNEALAEITNSTESYNTAFDTVINNTGKRIDIEFKKISRFFQTMVDDTLRSLDTVFGGFENVTVAIKALAHTLTGTFKAAMIAASWYVLTLVANFKALEAVTQRNLIILAITAGLYAINAIIEKGKANAAKIDEITKKNQDAWRQRELKNIDDVQDARLKAYKEANQEQLKLLAEQSAVSARQLKVEEDAYKRFFQLAKRAGTETTTAIKKSATALKKEIKELDKLIDTSKGKLELSTAIEDSTIKRRLSGADEPGGLEPSALRKYEFLQALIVQKQEDARRAALKLDKESYKTAKDKVLEYTDALLAIRDENKELQSLIHGQTFYNYQVEQLAISQNEMAREAAKQKAIDEERLRSIEKLQYQAKKLSDFIGKEKISDLLKIEDPLELQAAINERVYAAEELIKIQRQLGKNVSDPTALATAIAEIQKISAQQINRLSLAQERERILAIEKEYELREKEERELLKLWTQGMRALGKLSVETRERLLKVGIAAKEEASNYASGGMGIDTQLVRISPNETIMNPAATRRFYSTLTAMNAGIQRFSGGGAPINYNIGDINLSTPMQAGKIDVITLGKNLRREIRRGRVRLH